MGSFQGHAQPGTFFIFFAIWQAVDIYRRYFRSVRTGQQFTNRPSVSTGCCCSKEGGRCSLPLEAVLKIVLTCIGIAGEFITGFEGGHFTHFHNAQHMTMFAFFTLNGLVDLVYHFKVPAVPKQLDYLSAILAFAVEGILFAWHLMGRPAMDVQVHTFLVYIISMCILSTFLEMLAPNDVRPALVRVGFIFVQGTWFWHVGQILYPIFGTPYNQDDHTDMMIVTMMFTWHLAFAVIVMALLGATVYWCGARGEKKTTTLLPVLTNSSSKKKTPAVAAGTEYKKLADSEDVAMSMFSDDDDE